MPRKSPGGKVDTSEKGDRSKLSISANWILIQIAKYLRFLKFKHLFYSYIANYIKYEQHPDPQIIEQAIMATL